jgi:two-component system, response regulator YcbB
VRFFLVDDDDPIRAILSDIIEDENLGTVVGEGIDGSEIHLGLLLKKRVDVLIIDLLMPNRDGIETIREIGQQFPGKVVMLSQVETKELIGEAYSLGIDYYITKPVNRLEVLHVLKKIRENILLEKSILDFQTSLSQLRSTNFSQRGFDYDGKNKATQFQIACKTLLTDLGIISECGHKDLLDILYVMYQQGIDEHSSISSLKTLFEQAAMKRYGCTDDLQKEIKSSEQRVRRAIHQSLSHIASLGLSNYSNPIFEQYASKFFDFTQVRFKMSELRTNPADCTSHARVNIKKFIQALYMEAMSQLRE